MKMFRLNISSSVSVSWPNHSRVYRRYMGSSIEELSSNTANSLKRWVLKTHKSIPHRGSSNYDKIVNFWVDFYQEIIKKEKDYDVNVCLPKDDDDFFKKEEVAKHLIENRNNIAYCDNNHDKQVLLKNLQLSIEGQTLNFDKDTPMYKQVPNRIRDIILKKEKEKEGSYQTAKDFLKSHNLLSEDEKESLDVFGKYTLEVLFMHVLSTLFNAITSSSFIRLSALIDRLDTAVLSQIKLLKNRQLQREMRTKQQQTSDDKDASVEVEQTTTGTQKAKKKKAREFHIGVGLAEFLQEVKLIEVHNLDNVDDEPARKKKGQFYVAKHQNVSLTFNAKELPIKFTLPMVYKPVPWHSINEYETPRYLSHLRGGYFNCFTAEIEERYRLLSSHDMDNYYIELNDNPELLCKIMNKLQDQPFKVNSVFLNYIRENESLLVEYGLLLPSYLSKLQFKDLYEILKKKYYESNFRKGIRFSTFLKELSQLIQRASYEQYILKLAIVYEGYLFYFPAFLDFRGRIYRSGILHFHERDLARSLVIFATEDAPTQESSDPFEYFKKLCTASAFHFKGFTTEEGAYAWFDQEITTPLRNMKGEIPHQLYEFVSSQAKKPLQFMSFVAVASLCVKTNDYKNPAVINTFPITKDASASAYQLMSYFLLDRSLAKFTNLINPNSEEDAFYNKMVIQDVYDRLLDEVKEFIRKEYPQDPLILNVGEKLVRNNIKRIFMPMIYGKTVMSTALYLQESLSFDLGKHSKTVAKVFYTFFQKIYCKLYCLMDLIKNIGWFNSERNLAVLYRSPFYTTIQDYRKTTSTHIWVHDKTTNSKRKVTLSIPSDDRDSRKTMTSTFVNFIHQKDASLAMWVVAYLSDVDDVHLYTVHDNFISTVGYSEDLPYFYLEAFKDMGPPLILINDFIYMNLKTKYTPYLGYKGIIPSEELENLLNDCIPEALRGKKNTWTKKKTLIIKSYEAYVNAVCSSYDEKKIGHSTVNYTNHEKKWKQFQQALSKYYCLHH